MAGVRAVTSAEMRRLEREAEEKFGIRTLILMENAGRSVADALTGLYGKGAHRVLVACGPGNNGGDGFVAARHLRNRGCAVTVVLAGDPSVMKPDARENFEIVRKMKIPLHRDPPRAELARLLSRADIVVDALFGTGLKRRLGAPYAAVIRAVNAAQKKVVSVDVPSGVDADTGGVRGCAVRADLTVSLGRLKTGLLRGQGKTRAGVFVIADIGLPR